MVSILPQKNAEGGRFYFPWIQLAIETLQTFERATELDKITGSTGYLPSASFIIALKLFGKKDKDITEETIQSIL